MPPSASRARGGLMPRSRAVSSASTPGSNCAVMAEKSSFASTAAKRVRTTVQRWPRVSTLVVAAAEIVTTEPSAYTSSASGPISGKRHGSARRAGALHDGGGFARIGERTAQRSEQGSGGGGRREHLLPVAAHRRDRVRHQRRQRDGRQAARRIEAEQLAHRAAGPCPAPRATDWRCPPPRCRRRPSPHRAKSGRAWRSVAAEHDAVGREHKGQAPLRVERETHAQRVGARDGRSGRRRARDCRAAPGSRPHAETRQSQRFAGHEIDAQQIDGCLHPRRVVAELDAEARGEARIAARPLIDARAKASAERRRRHRSALRSPTRVPPSKPAK